MAQHAMMTTLSSTQSPPPTGHSQHQWRSVLLNICPRRPTTTPPGASLSLSLSPSSRLATAGQPTDHVAMGQEKKERGNYNKWLRLGAVSCDKSSGVVTHLPVWRYFKVVLYIIQFDGFAHVILANRRNMREDVRSCGRLLPNEQLEGAENGGVSKPSLDWNGGKWKVCSRLLLVPTL